MCRIFELELKLQDTITKLVKQEEYKRYISNLQEEMLIWYIYMNALSLLISIRRYQHQIDVEKIEKAK